MSVHRPILVEPIVQSLAEPFRSLGQQDPPHWLVDCTLGGGGHCDAFLRAFENEKFHSNVKILAFDKDLGAVERGRERFKDAIALGRLEVVHCSISEAVDVLKDRPILGVLADLGFSSDQLEDPTRGLSFHSEGPLDMRLDQSRGRSCKQLLEEISEPELAQILEEWGEERFARRIASKIISLRRVGQLPSNTKELSQSIVKAIPAAARHGRIHAATKTFQALRIAVNEELSELDSLLNHVIVKVKVGGRIAILSFHSLEDRKVKNTFKNNPIFKPLTKKPVQADESEITVNPRSRSAKLRVAERR